MRYYVDAEISTLQAALFDMNSEDLKKLGALTKQKLLPGRATSPPLSCSISRGADCERSGRTSTSSNAWLKNKLFKRHAARIRRPSAGFCGVWRRHIMRLCQLGRAWAAALRWEFLRRAAPCARCLSCRTAPG